MGFRRAKSTQGNTNCQKNIFEDDQVPGHHPRALIYHRRKKLPLEVLTIALLSELCFGAHVHMECLGHDACADASIRY